MATARSPSREFENALGAGGTNLAKADDVFGKLDNNGDGSVSLDEMSSALKGGRGHHRPPSHGEGSGDSVNDPLPGVAGRESSTTVTNADGSTTTSLTYADGSKVTMTSPARLQFVEHGDLVLQFHRAVDPAPGEGDLVAGQFIHVCQRLVLR